MPPKKWDDEESDASSSEASSSVPVGARRAKFDDEEDEADVLDSWDAAEDSEVEREKAKKAADAKAKAEAEAAANKKSKKQRIAEHQAARARELAESGEESEEETEADRRARMRATEKDSDLKHAEDLFGNAGLSVGTGKGRSTTTIGSAVPLDPKDPSKTVDLSAMPLFNPQTKLQFENMRAIMTPIIGNNYKKAHYTMFLQEFSKQLAKDLPSDQIKKIASTLTALSNEKMREEKAADKSGKKTKAQKTKTTLVTARANTQDTANYENEDFGEYVIQPVLPPQMTKTTNIACSEDFM
ncbi:eukaryotic translation initiation factor 3 subunit J [Microdochium trichocladiopsis]|uniref:Eukaryotic translation initiation factor 3 subunit J n=1 Tax=Microdochium trichocladiopsis TaxID=1682393 RepID=A0A9P8YB79_9PEZI|nr:eukaryotic translation initiation factor 3 subunit J [Microdochium trichocladiopsis]KAH7034854.1 eukaryotic translation initiation factor 3 subunit J [Microdochium trichocladiopsis]